MTIELVKTLTPHSLGTAEIHIWHLKPEQVALQPFEDAFYSITPVSNHTKYEKFLFLPKRREFMMTRVFIRNVLSKYVDVGPERWDSRTNHYGCPEILFPVLSTPLNFNISHTDGLITIAVALGREIGVDIENRERQIAAVDLAQSAFSPSESEVIAHLMPWERRQKFYEYWTLKEAYIKARGMGMSIPTDQFTLTVPSGGAPIQVSFGSGIQDEPKSWEFRLLQPTEVHQCALAYRKKEATESVEVKEFEYDPLDNAGSQKELKIA